ncbi:PqqD family protein [Rathayibacter caricis]|uniref:PqqD family protein n=1 Tax=Rathayibacter caricis TaxID=110936 RepID=UPI001FB4BED1|nr:PqqD family protein [Rathayibacter caricis]MCJ1694922.1 PqqD family protein [Rathayibacter caricis]
MTADGPDSEAPSPYLRLGRSIAYEESLDRALVLNMDTGSEIMEFTGTALSIWRRALSAADFDEIVQNVSRDYGTTPVLVEQDCRTFIEHLVSKGVLATGTVD